MYFADYISVLFVDCPLREVPVVYRLMLPEVFIAFKAITIFQMIGMKQFAFFLLQMEMISN